MRAHLLLCALALAAGCGHAARPPTAHPAGTDEVRASAPTRSAPAAEPDPDRIPVVVAGVRRRASLFRLEHLTADQRRLTALHCPLGRPRWWAPVAPPAALQLLARDGYVLEHSAEDKVALFVCAHVDPADLGGGVDRKERFAPDPQLAPGRRAELEDYKGSGYSRGHQAPSADQTRSRERNDATFYLSNMTPQLQALNGGPWAQLEKRVRSWAQRFGGAWVVTGPLFHDPAEEDPATADGVVEHPVIGAGQVSVPTHYFKVVVARIDGHLHALAFVFPNATPPKGMALDEAQVTIDWIEARSGLDLLPELGAAEEAQLEGSAEALWE